MARESVNFEVFYTAHELSALVEGWGKKKFGRVKRGIQGRIHHFEKIHGGIAGDETPPRHLRGNLQILTAQSAEASPVPEADKHL